MKVMDQQLNVYWDETKITTRETHYNSRSWTTLRLSPGKITLFATLSLILVHNRRKHITKIKLLKLLMQRSEDFISLVQYFYRVNKNIRVANKSVSL